MSATVMLSQNFSLAEFEKASHAPLTAMQVVRAKELAAVLQQARTALKTRIVISNPGGFVRTRNIGGGSHADGHGVDFYPLDVSMGELFNWLGAHQRHAFGRLIYERNHIHMTLPGDQPWAGRGLVFVEPTEGEYFPLLFEAITQPLTVASKQVAEAFALPQESANLLWWLMLGSILILVAAAVLA